MNDVAKERSDGSTAGYYVIPDHVQNLHQLIGHKKMNYNISSIFKKCYDYSWGNDSIVLPNTATELQDLISYCNMNAQIGEIFRACYRYGLVEHSDCLRDAKKIKYYLEAELQRLNYYHSELEQQVSDCQEMLTYIEDEIESLAQVEK